MLEYTTLNNNNVDNYDSAIVKYGSYRNYTVGDEKSLIMYINELLNFCKYQLLRV